MLKVRTEEIAYRKQKQKIQQSVKMSQNLHTKELDDGSVTLQQSEYSAKASSCVVGGNSYGEDCMLKN